MDSELKPDFCPVCMAGTQPNPYDESPGCTCGDLPPNDAKQEAVRDKLQDAIRAARGGDAPTTFKGYA